MDFPHAASTHQIIRRRVQNEQLIHLPEAAHHDLANRPDELASLEALFNQLALLL